MNAIRRFCVIGAFAFVALFLFVSKTIPALVTVPWYVATTGDDTINDCLTLSTPCATINGALNKLSFAAGDTIKVAIGTYTYTGTGSEVVVLNRSAALSGGWDATFATQSGMSTIDGQGVILARTKRGIFSCRSSQRSSRAQLASCRNPMYIKKVVTHTRLLSGRARLKDSCLRHLAKHLGKSSQKIAIRFNLGFRNVRHDRHYETLSVDGLGIRMG